MTEKKAASKILNMIWVQLCIIEGNTHIHKNRKEIHQEVNSSYFWVVELQVILFFPLYLFAIFYIFWNEYVIAFIISNLFPWNN